MSESEEVAKRLDDSVLFTFTEDIQEGTRSIKRRSSMKMSIDRIDPVSLPETVTLILALLRKSVQ